jgi:hypothetical protein
MKRYRRCFTVFSALLGATFGAQPGLAQKPGGILRVYHWDSPAYHNLDHVTADAAYEATFQYVDP